MKKILFLVVLIYTSSIFAQDSTFRIKPTWVNPEYIFEQPKKEIKSDTITDIKKDKEFLEKIQQTINGSSTPADIKDLAVALESKLQQLIKEKEELLKNNATQEEIDAKDQEINTVKKDKSIIDLTLDKIGLSETNESLKTDQKFLKRFLYGAIATILALVLFLVVVWQKKKIKTQDDEIQKQLEDITKKNSYIEHAARIIRHDMHSGINTYMPRGLSSLEKKLKPEDIEKLKIDTSLKMIKEGLTHTQRVYKGVYEFTNLVKQDVVLNKTKIDVKEVLLKNFTNTSYLSQIIIEDLGEIEINEVLFCTAIDSLIKNGLKYNDSENKLVKIYQSEDYIVVEDNGRGMTQKEFDKHSKPKSFENGLGISISVAILKEHSFSVSCEKNNGTKIKIKVK